MEMGEEGRSRLPAGRSERPELPAYRVHPVALARVAGQPFEKLEAFAFPAALEVCCRLEGLEGDGARRQSGLERALHTAVGGTADPEAREALIKASRNLRRNHKLSADQEEALLRFGGADIAEDLRHWREAQAAVLDAERALEAAFAEEHAGARRALRLLVQDPAFQRGLLQSRASLFNDFRDNLRIPFEQLPRNRNQRRLELALLRYFTRSATKTSPFTTLTAIAPARLAELPPESLVLLPGPGGDRASVALNKVLYAIVGRILRQTPALFRCFSVTLNPTLHARDGQYVMLVPRAGREQVAKLPLSGALTRCIERIEAAGGTLPYEDCRAELAAILDADADAAGARLDKMIAIGLLALNTGIADQERDWAPKLGKLLETAEDPMGAELAAGLAELEEIRAAYGEADAEARTLLLDRSRACLDRLVAGLASTPEGSDLEAGFRAQQLGALRQNLLFEDVSLPGPALLSRARLGPALEDLASWVDAMSSLTPKWADHATMREHYARCHGDAGRVAFPRFYETFFEEVFEKVLLQERGALDIPVEEAVNPYGLPIFEQVKSAADAVCISFCDRWAADFQAERLTLTRAGLELPEPLLRMRPQGPGSTVVFAQAVPRSPLLERDGLVVDRQLVQSGMGRYHSRFLHQLDAGLTEALRRTNERAAALVAEICDDSELSFNANLHPRLTEREINYPSLMTGLNPRTNLSLAELDVEPDPEHTFRLRLVHRPTGRDVLPVDLGFLAHQLRPPLFRVLLLFSPLFQHQMTIPWRIPGLPQDDVISRPRVLFEDHLVLARRAWRTAASYILGVAGSGTGAQRFRRLDGWRRSHGLPDDVFYSLRDDGPPPALPGKPPQRILRRLASKPQYASFRSALLVEAMLDALQDHGGSVVLEEMLPSPGMLARRGGDSHALELVLQLDRER